MRKVKTRRGRRSNAEIALLTKSGMMPKKAGFTWADLEGQTIQKVVSVDNDSMKLQLSNGTTFFVQGHGPVAFNFVTEVKTTSDFYHEMPNFNDGGTSSILQCVQTNIPDGLTAEKSIAEYATVVPANGQNVGPKTVSLLRIPYKTQPTEGVDNAGATATTNQ